ncbi:hypothetical protein ACERC6_06175 [Moraxella sp. E33BD]
MFKLFCNKTKKNPPASIPKCSQYTDDVNGGLIGTKNPTQKVGENVDESSKINWSFVLRSMPSYFPILTFIAILVGAFKSRSYLGSIGYDSIFSEVIGSPSALIGIVVAYFFSVLLLAVYFLLYFLLFLFLNNIDKALQVPDLNRNGLMKKIQYCYAFISFMILIWGLSIYFDWLDDDSFLLYLGLAFVVMLPLVLLVTEFRKSANLLFLSAICFLVFGYSYVYPFLYAQIIIAFEMRKDWQWYIFFALPITGIIINIASLFIFNRQEEKSFSPKDSNRLVGFICVFIFIGFVAFLGGYTKFSDLSLYAPRFIERPSNSSWYLIHNGNTTSQTINGMTKEDIKQKKELRFHAKDCEDYLGESYKEKCETDNQDTLNQRPEALYGYMAWNLGDIKVFCPVSVDFFEFSADENQRLNQADKEDGNIEKEKSHILAEKSRQCIAINKQFLQPVSGYYLSHAQ